MLKTLVLLAVGISCVAAQSCNIGGIYSSKFNKCYQFFSAPTQFEDAEEQCISLGGHLVSVVNGEENALVSSNADVQLVKSNYTDYWIGANDLSTPGKWQWTDGSIFNYNLWDAGEPIGGDCALKSKGSLKWKTNDCQVYLPYVCATPPIIASTCPPQTTPKPTTCPTPPPCPTKTCVPSCDQGWTYFQPTDFCYHVYHLAMWDDAEAACVLLGGHLASIHSEIENTFVNNLAACGIKEGKTNELAWIGMHKVGQDWVWTDGTRSDYFNWAPKQPDNPGKENCVETAPDVSHDKWYENWNNEPCNTIMRAYVCKKASYHV
ncbi:unnamed protein product [Caenorhabditis bovis]|uniref:C-type lectin domain-containing protein n=1 Tax=Caenorhabditis bovis TaxID=2654633 RepID=A0A8S1E6E9_9PELO|nr:unnamed protein product [Caenorhabditis bovis]